MNLKVFVTMYQESYTFPNQLACFMVMYSYQCAKWNQVRLNYIAFLPVVKLITRSFFIETVKSMYPSVLIDLYLRFVYCKKVHNIWWQYCAVLLRERFVQWPLKHMSFIKTVYAAQEFYKILKIFVSTFLKFLLNICCDIQS